MTFPQPPHDIGRTHQIGDKIWTWDGEKWFADYDSLAPVFQVKPDEGLVNLNLGIGSDFDLALDADTLQNLNVPTQLVIGNIIITPSIATPEIGDTVIYTYTRDGNEDDHSFLDLSTDIGGAQVTGNTIEFTQLGSGTVTMRVESATATDSPATGTLAVTVVPVATTIGTVTITGDTNPTVGDTVTYGFSITGDAQDAVGVLTTNISGVSVSGDEIEFLQSGSGYVEYEVTSQTSSDSPVVERLNVNVAAAPPYQNISNISGPSALSVGAQENFEVTYLGSDTPSYNWTYAAPYEFTQNASITGTSDDVSFLNRYHSTDGDLTTYATIHFKDWFGALLRWDVEDKAFPDRVDTLEILVSDPTGNGSSGQIANHRTNTATKFERVFASDPNNPQWSMLLNAGTNQPMYENWGNGGTRDNLVKFLWSVPSGATVTNSLNIHAIRVGSDIIRLDPRNQLAANVGDLIQVKFNGPGDHKISCVCTDAGGSTTKEFDVQITGDLAYTQVPDPVPSFEVTVVNTADGNKYFIDGVRQDNVTMVQGMTYRFNTYDSSNYGHPLRIYTDSSKATEVTQGVTIGSSHTFFTPASTGTFSYQCSAHANMGGDIIVT